jgi:hypothetical protein
VIGGECLPTDPEVYVTEVDRMYANQTIMPSVVVYVAGIPEKD